MTDLVTLFCVLVVALRPWRWDEEGIHYDGLEQVIMVEEESIIHPTSQH